MLGRGLFSERERAPKNSQEERQEVGGGWPLGLPCRTRVLEERQPFFAFEAIGHAAEEPRF